MKMNPKVILFPADLADRIQAHADQQAEQNGEKANFSQAVRGILHRHFAQVDADNEAIDNDCDKILDTFRHPVIQGT